MCATISAPIISPAPLTNKRISMSDQHHIDYWIAMMRLLVRDAGCSIVSPVSNLSDGNWIASIEKESSIPLLCMASWKETPGFLWRKISLLVAARLVCECVQRSTSRVLPLFGFLLSDCIGPTYGSKTLSKNRISIKRRRDSVKGQESFYQVIVIA